MNSIYTELQPQHPRRLQRIRRGDHDAGVRGRPEQPKARAEGPVVRRTGAPLTSGLKGSRARRLDAPCGRLSGVASGSPARKSFSTCASRCARSPLSSPAAWTVRCRVSSMRACRAGSDCSIFGIAASAASRSRMRLKYCSRSICLKACSVHPWYWSRIWRRTLNARSSTPGRPADIDQGADRGLAGATLGDAGLEFGDAPLDQCDALRLQPRPLPDGLVRGPQPDQGLQDREL